MSNKKPANEAEHIRWLKETRGVTIPPSYPTYVVCWWW